MYDKQKLLEILLHADFRTLDDHGKPFPPSACVYTSISKNMKEFGSSIEPKHVYTIVNQNRNGYKDEILKAFEIQNNEEQKQDNSNYSMNTTSSTNHENSKEAESKNFHIILSPEQWAIIKPLRKLYGRRFKYTMQSGWTDIIAEKLWTQQKLSCVISFKKHDVSCSSSARNFISIIGHCKECDALLYGTIQNEPPNNVDVKIHISIKHIRQEEHSNRKTRHLKGKRREMIADAIIGQCKDAITYRREEAKRLKEFGDPNPPILPSSTILRKAKEQRLLQQHNLVFANPALNLLNSAKYGKYVGTIHNISLMEFSVIYWSPEQELLYKMKHKRSPEGFMTIDASGGFVKKSSPQEPPIFLYQCMFVDDNNISIPVFQMISADHKAMHIAYFLRKIISRGMAIPHTVVSDFGWAILIAIAEVFAKCSDLRDYLQRCYGILMGTVHTLPFCYIRLDVSHIIAMVARWPCLKGKDKILVRRYIMRCVGQAYQMSSFKHLEYTLESILTLTLSEYVGSDENGEPLPSEIRRCQLDEIIKGTSLPSEVDVEIDVADEQADNANDVDDHLNSSDSDWSSWSTTLLHTATQLATESKNGCTINACYNPEFAKLFKTRLIPYVPLWTGVMRGHFQRGQVIATSSSVESNFTDLKQRAFKGQLPMRVDKFVQKHLDYLDGCIKLTSSEKDTVKAPENVADISSEIETSSSTASEEIREESQEKSDTQISGDKTLPHSAHNYNYSTGATEPLKEQPMNSDQTIWNSYENWRGLVKPEPEESATSSRKRKKPSYLDECAEWDYLKTARYQNIPLMRNGSKCAAVKINNSEFTVQQTCAFDAIFHVIAVGIATIKNYKEVANSYKNATMKLAAAVLHDGKIHAKHYIERAFILVNLPLFNDAITTYTRSIKKLNANCNAADLLSKLFNNMPSCTKTTSCICGNEKVQQITEVNVNVDILLCKGLQYVQEAIDDASSIGTTCRKCKSNVAIKVEYGSHIFIDTTIFTDDTYIATKHALKHQLGNIATSIQLQSNTYTLTGIVNYTKSVSNRLDDGHYTAYARTGIYWYLYDDLKKKRQTATTQTAITPHILFYVRNT